MTISALLQLRLRGTYKIRNLNLVQDWWPKPVITALPKKHWGTRKQNLNSGCLHKYKCSSFSAIGFHTNYKQVEGLPGNLCFAYGESPQSAYDRWCELFNSWNNKEQWVK